MNYPLKIKDGEDFAPGKYAVFLRYKDGLSRAFEINATTEDGYRYQFEQCAPRTDNIVYIRSRRDNGGSRGAK